VNQDSMRNLQLGLAGVGRLLMPLAIIWLLGVIGLGWLVKSFLILVGLILLTPVIAVIGLQWWLRRNLVKANCPVCQFELMGLNGSQFQCPSCGEPLKFEQGQLARLTPPGTIDVSAVEVQVQVLDD